MWELSESKKKAGIGSHHREGVRNYDWFTPPEIVRALGPFELDPCSSENRPFDTALSHYTIEQNGLACKWSGRVWCNPPYGQQTGKWLRVLADHGNGIALVFARTETEAWFKYVWKRADAILFLNGRLNFYRVDGKRSLKNSGGPSALIAYGERNVKSLRLSCIPGALAVRRETEWGFELKNS